MMNKMDSLMRKALIDDCLTDNHRIKPSVLSTHQESKASCGELVELVRYCVWDECLSLVAE